MSEVPLSRFSCKESALGQCMYRRAVEGGQNTQVASLGGGRETILHPPPTPATHHETPYRTYVSMALGRSWGGCIFS